MLLLSLLISLWCAISAFKRLSIEFFLCLNQFIGESCTTVKLYDFLLKGDNSVILFRESVINEGK